MISFKMVWSKILPEHKNSAVEAVRPFGVRGSGELLTVEQVVAVGDHLESSNFWGFFHEELDGPFFRSSDLRHTSVSFNKNLRLLTFMCI